MTDPRLLAIDAATETVHLALLCGGALRVRALPAGAQASATLLPAVQGLLAEAGCTLAQLDAIGFGRGPGAFTGLRTACAVAQGLALGSGRPLLALDTLAAVAESAHQRCGVDQVWAATDARMGEVYAACWQRLGPGHWQLRQSAALYSPASLAAAVARHPVAVAGNALALPALQEALGSVDAALVQIADAAPDGAALAALAQAAWQRGETLDPALALPLYVRDKVAQTTAERLAARPAAQPSTTAP
ncbi:tRNA (adenosine(37)-N6)-threonylcarbamoyltransferase complex dimerization subunit type 1 TsaB [Sphaerotilus microaerophilus]|nr:tRNA (adenosine(37)-N6)-threonylcarbamoyltransferase complex dimerization subunit type 1 TsaB [Sphaerotilus sp. FB-5]